PLLMAAPYRACARSRLAEFPDSCCKIREALVEFCEIHTLLPITGNGCSVCQPRVSREVVRPHERVQRRFRTGGKLPKVIIPSRLVDRCFGREQYVVSGGGGFVQRAWMDDITRRARRCGGGEQRYQKYREGIWSRGLVCV